jgi:hypothetical protein
MTPEQFARQMREAGPKVEAGLRALNERLAKQAAEKARGNVYSTVPGSRGTGRGKRSGAGSISRTRASIGASGTDRGGIVSLGGPGAPGAAGHEFGGGSRPRTRQFPRPTKEGYFLYPAIREITGSSAPFEKMLDDVLED